MSVKRPHEEAEHENEERWLLTYADLITLLMVFFVVMYAMSQVDAQKFQQLAATLSGAFSGSRTVPLPVPGTGGLQGKDDTSRSRGNPPTDAPAIRKRGLSGGMAKTRDEFNKLVQKEGLQSSVTVKADPLENKLIVRLADSLLFPAGSDTFSTEAIPLLETIGRILSETGQAVSIEGHTDNVPISNGRINSNWELSVLRATNVLRYLEDTAKLSPLLLSASGYAEHRPIATGDTPEDRAKNRRVEFVIHETTPRYSESAEQELPLAPDAVLQPGAAPAPETAPAEETSPTSEAAPATATSHE